MQNSIIKKGLIFGVIFLFIGITFAPSLYANNLKEDNFVEVNIEFCGLEKEHTIQLTHQEMNELDILFESIKNRLYDAVTKKETIQIFNEAVEELNSFNLLGELNVKQVQKLITGVSYKSRFIHLLDRLNDKNQVNNDSNLFCLIAGKTNFTFFSFYKEIFFLTIFSLAWELCKYFHKDILAQLMIAFFYGFPYYNSHRLVHCKTIVAFGGYVDFPYIEPATGWIFTNGLKGKKWWNGTFYGNLEVRPWDYHPGITGFRGIKLLLNENVSKYFYLGYARRIKIEKI